MPLSILNNDVFANVLSFIKKNELIFLKEVSTIFNDIINQYYKEFVKFPNKSTIFSNPNYLEWAMEHDYHLNKYEMYENGIKYGGISVLNWLYDQYSHKHFKIRLYNHAIAKSDIGILEWLKNHLCPYQENMYVPFTDNPIYIWVQKYLPRNENQLYDIVKEGDLKKVIWALNSVPDLKQYLCECCARTGNMQILKWAYQNKIESDTNTITAAAQTGNFKMLKWLFRHKFKYNEYAVAEACVFGNVNIVEWLLENDFPIDEWAYIESLSHNNFEILEHLIGNKKLNYKIDFNEYFSNIDPCIIKNMYTKSQKYPIVFNWLENNNYFDLYYNKYF